MANASGESCHDSEEETDPDTGGDRPLLQSRAEPDFANVGDEAVSQEREENKGDDGEEKHVGLRSVAGQAPYTKYLSLRHSAQGPVVAFLTGLSYGSAMNWLWIIGLAVFYPVAARLDWLEQAVILHWTVIVGLIAFSVADRARALVDVLNRKPK